MEKSFSWDTETPLLGKLASKVKNKLLQPFTTFTTKSRKIRKLCDFHREETKFWVCMTKTFDSKEPQRFFIILWKDPSQTGPALVKF